MSHTIQSVQNAVPPPAPRNAVVATLGGELPCAIHGILCFIAFLAAENSFPCLPPTLATLLGVLLDFLRHAFHTRRVGRRLKRRPGREDCSARPPCKCTDPRRNTGRKRKTTPTPPSLGQGKTRLCRMVWRREQAGSKKGGRGNARGIAKTSIAFLPKM